jgi:hypothetical protein
VEIDHLSIDWEEMTLCLYAFTDNLLRKKYWFRKATDGSFIKGKEVHDYVADGLERYLSEPEKYDASKGSLADYIKFNIIRGMVSNDVTSAENETSVDLFTGEQENEESYSTYIEALLPFAAALIDEQMDYDLVVEYMEREAKGDSIVEEILLGLEMGLKRREIIEETGMSAQVYDNGMKRLNTIFKKTVSQFNLENSHS